MSERDFPAYADRDPNEGPDDPPSADLELTPAEPVAPDDPALPVETVEGKVLDVVPERRRGQPQIRILPGFLRSPADFTSAVVYQGRHTLTTVAFHTIRLPGYWLQLAKRSPIGFWVALSWWARWVGDARRTDYLRDLNKEQSREYRDLDKSHVLAVKIRWLLTIAAVVLLTAAGWWAHHNLRTGVLIVTAAIVTAVLGFLGRPVGRPIISRAQAFEAPPLTENTIAIALGALGVGELNRALKMDPANAIRFHPPGPHRDGPGVRIDIDLPAGVTAGQIISKREPLASGLRRPVSSVWPEGDPEAHEGRLVLWVADRPMSKQKPVPWPLTLKGSVNLFEPFVIGTDPRGKPITITLMFALMLIGAQPRMGKSFLLRLLLLAAALDIRAELHIFDLRGSADLLPLEAVAHRLQSGDDDEDVARLLSEARALREDMRRRYKTIKRLDRSICPEGKVTSQLASRRDLGLHPILWVVDECQVAFEHPEYGKELAAVFTDLGKRGPAAGITLILATQRPDAKSIPTGLSSNAILRFCLRVGDQVANDMILGTSAYKAGIRATMFARSERGIGYLVGEGDDPVITRVAYVDAPAAEKIAARARQMRQAANLLTGQAAGEEFDQLEAGPSMLDHLVQHWPADEEKLSYAAIAELLTGALPDDYPGCTQEQVGTTLRARGVPRAKVTTGEHRGRQGAALDAVRGALAAREPEPQDDDQ